MVCESNLVNSGGLCFSSSILAKCSRFVSGRAPCRPLACVTSRDEGKKVKVVPTRLIEQQLLQNGYRRICGVDEVGRGPLAGPVVATAVILPDQFHIELKGDSKKYTEKQRLRVYEEIMAFPGVEHASCTVTARDIDRLNIGGATMYALAEAARLVGADYALIDGNRVPGTMNIPCHTIVKGDTSESCISVASIIAKVQRDRFMVELDKKYPGYGFKSNKGYGSLEHRNVIMDMGPTPEHRRSFAPLSRMNLSDDDKTP
ncbi:hypothetical protein NDN08_002964 [Rhodosorus marinus]|uniref:Ribonuclease n=1 Tax=Rhodosorus marinus TaxID=101924 RepID=A0AAV8UV64_9RHOD|nr:hypothetical protein NDN08_002964 [Rhodosorus marinus]